MTVNELTEKHAAECVEALLLSVTRDSGRTWFCIVEEHMRNLVCDIEEIASHSRNWNNKARFP